MTDDLVKRLRNNCSCNFSSTPCGAEEECRNAFEGADRIEKLEAALGKIMDTDPDERTSWFHYIARKALEGKE
jgi:hypothetical protein